MKGKTRSHSRTKCRPSRKQVHTAHLRKGTYYVSVRASHPEYKLRTRVYDPPPYAYRNRPYDRPGLHSGGG